MYLSKLFALALSAILLASLAGRVVAQSPGETFKTVFEAANNYAAEQRWPEAIAAYKQAIRLDPNQAQAYCRLGVVYATTNQSKDAIKVLKQAVKIDPDYAEGQYQLGQILTKLGHYDEAIDAYRLAVSLKHDDAAMRFALAEAYLKSGRTEKALQQHEKLKELDEKLAAQLFDDMFFRKVTDADSSENGSPKR